MRIRCSYFYFIYFLHFKTDLSHRTATESILLTFSQVTNEHKLALQIITYIGCGLSLAGETLTIVAYALLLYAKVLIILQLLYFLVLFS